MYAQIDVTGTAVDLHSGGFGGVVENPANALAQIIAGLKGPDGRIRVPGFYDDVVPLSPADREAFAALPFDEEAYREEIGVPALVGEVGYTMLERRGGRPTLDVNGIWGGFQGEGSKTIIPAHAHAKVSCRLVADQDPNVIFAAFRDYVAEIAPPGVHVSVELLGGGRPSLTPMDHPATLAAARALEATFGRAPVFIREGGSIPVCAAFSIDPRPARRPVRFRPARRERARPERVDGPGQLRGRHPGHRPALGRARDAASLTIRTPSRHRSRAVRIWYLWIGDSVLCGC